MTVKGQASKKGKHQIQGHSSLKGHNHIHEQHVGAESHSHHHVQRNGGGSGYVHSHAGMEGEHGHTHTAGEGGHGHVHSHEHTKAVINRLARAIGHLESIKRMVEDGRDCSEVLIQLSSVKAAINNTGKIILQDHIQHCIVDAVETGDQQVIDELNKAIDQFVK